MRFWRTSGLQEGDNQAVAEAPLLAAIEDGGAGDVRWSDDGKHGALHAINAWLIAEGTTGMPDEMPELRDELMRDLRLPPFDEEIPTTRRSAREG